MNDGQLAFFGGLNTTGGVQLLYSKGRSALQFDFGIAHKGLLEPSVTFTGQPLRAVPGREVRQYVLGRMAPPVLDLYDFTRTMPVSPEEVRQVWGELDLPELDKLGIFVGHMHQDHMALLPFAHPDVPVYMNRDAYALYRGMVAAGEPDTRAQIVPCDDGSFIDFGSFTVQIVEMDHNTVGTSAILIESDEHTIAVTGDYRRHGRHPERIDTFIELCRSKKIDLLITEATRSAAPSADKPGHAERESAVLAAYGEELAKAAGLVYVHILSRDLERLADFIHLADRAGRKVALDPSLAVIWHTAGREGVKALADHPAWTAEIKIIDGMPCDRAAQLPYGTVSLTEISQHKPDYAYFVSYFNSAAIIELEALGGARGQSVYVHADHPVRPGQADLAKFLKTYGIADRSIGNGGHAHPDEVSDLIERIAPKAVIPLHSWHPTTLDTRGIPAFYPQQGDVFGIGAIVAGASAAVRAN